MPPPLSVSGRVRFSPVRPPVTVSPVSIKSPAASVKFNTRELSSSKSSGVPVVPPKLATTSVMNAASVMSSPFASPVMVTSKAVDPSMFSVSVISSSPPVKRIRLSSPPVNTDRSKLIKSGTGVLLLAIIASRREIPSAPGELSKLGTDEVSPLTASSELSTIN